MRAKPEKWRSRHFDSLCPKHSDRWTFISADARQIPRRCRSQTGWKIAKAPESCRARRISPARKYHQHVPDLSGLVSLNFREELHAIEAAVSGQGIAICSDLLVAPELASGALVKLTNVTMPGCAFYIVHRASHPKMASIKAFVAWAMEAR